MNFVKFEPLNAGNEDAGQPSTAALQMQLDELLDGLAALSVTGNTLKQADLLLDIGRLQNQLQDHAQAWESGWQAFRIYAGAEEWEGAIQACDILFLAGQPGSLAALGHGIWLSVTYPVNPELSVAMLERLIEETPDNSDGAAVAAATACYLVDLRAGANPRQAEDLRFYCNQLLGQVARRHSQVDSQALFDFWVERMQLDNPEMLLPRLGKIVDVLVQSNWWLDCAALRAKLPSP
jgi:hypothetical protein